MPRYRYAHTYAIVTKKGRLVGGLPEKFIPRSLLVADCKDWNLTHSGKHYVVKVEMTWKKPKT